LAWQCGDVKKGRKVTVTAVFLFVRGAAVLEFAVKQDGDSCIFL